MPSPPSSTTDAPHDQISTTDTSWAPRWMRKALSAWKTFLFLAMWFSGVILLAAGTITKGNQIDSHTVETAMYTSFAVWGAFAVVMSLYAVCQGGAFVVWYICWCGVSVFFFSSTLQLDASSLLYWSPIVIDIGIALGAGFVEVLDQSGNDDIRATLRRCLLTQPPEQHLPTHNQDIPLQNMRRRNPRRRNAQPPGERAQYGRQ